MSRLLLLVLLSLGFTTLHAQHLDTLRRKDANGWTFIQVRNNGIVLTEGREHDHIPEGVWTTFWDNGFPHNMVTYRNGKRDGVSLKITRDGYTELVENYVNDLLEGPRRTYNRSAAASEEAYFSEGKKSGAYISRYDNGQKREESNYNNDVRDGKTYYYNQDGQKSAEYTWERGVIQGDVSTFHPNGKISEFGMYSNDNQEGVWKEFYPSGTLKAEGKYVAGKKKGPWKQYDEQGKALKTINYGK